MSSAMANESPTRKSITGEMFADQPFGHQNTKQPLFTSEPKRILSAISLVAPSCLDETLATCNLLDVFVSCAHKQIQRYRVVALELGMDRQTMPESSTFCLLAIMHVHMCLYVPF